MVPEAGLEPAHGYPYRILSPARLPFHHSGTRAIISNGQQLGFQERMLVDVEKWARRIELAALGTQCFTEPLENRFPAFA